MYGVNQNSKNERLPAYGKVQALLADGAIETNEEFQPDLVCVVEGWMFETSFYIPSLFWFNIMRSEVRKKKWLIYKPARKISGY